MYTSFILKVFLAIYWSQGKTLNIIVDLNYDLTLDFSQINLLLAY